ncbi:MAG: epoxyqueuosine reductase QueH [Lachnospiraceae bacterium]|jgi:predicted adenine nucleotide alpha hydrolase (AANH) superfamily ATPase|nr:epoxyqueuosine reductase QueH [Lachnospiraceae bacterium]
MNKRNYQKELEQVIHTCQKEGKTPRLLLHSCCAPCSSYVLEYLSQYFYITVFYYNPNIYPPEEIRKRADEQERFITEMPVKHTITYLEGSYDPERFYQSVKGHESDKEGEERCFLCYRLRLEEAAKEAKAGGYDYFTTTLSISPLKNADKLNEIGEELAKCYGVSYLNSDFKKKNGYRRSVELSKEYGLYRQNYCGCVFSRTQALHMKKSE